MLALLAAHALAAPAAHKIFPYAYTQEDLPNGLRVITVPAGAPNIVSLYIIVQAGSRNEVEPGHTGFAHLFEHLMFKGTPHHSAAQYQDALTRIGAASNAYTTEDYTCFHATFNKEDLPGVLAMEADRFQNLAYTEPEFRTETQAVLGEYNTSASNPLTKLREALSDAAFDRGPYKHTVMGFLRDIQDMPNQYDYSRTFFLRYYRPEYTTILAVGDMKPRAVRELVDKNWGAWKRGDYRPSIPSDPSRDDSRTRHVDWPSPTLPLLGIGFRAPAYDDTTRDSAALSALAALAFSDNSDLYQRLVIREQKADILRASMSWRVDPALFQVTARVKTASDLDYVRDRILETVKGFRDKPADAAILDTVRRRERYSLALRLESCDSIASVLAPFIALKRSPETLNRLYDQYAQLTPGDVRAAAAKYLVDSGRTIVTLTGPGAAK